MEKYIIKELDTAKEFLESGIEFGNPQQIHKSRLIYDSLKMMTTDSEHWVTVKENMIRACTALCLLDSKNALQYLEMAYIYDPHHPEFQIE